jgi:hypothetical protein
MREICDHKTNATNDNLKIVSDDVELGGAPGGYLIIGFNAASNKSASPDLNEFCRTRALILFQNGPIEKVGVNGITQEALLAIVIDRLRNFQAGPCSCRENALALTATEEALMWLQKRTRDRQMRGVEGTTAK